MSRFLIQSFSGRNGITVGRPIPFFKKLRNGIAVPIESEEWPKMVKIASFSSFTTHARITFSSSFISQRECTFMCMSIVYVCVSWRVYACKRASLCACVCACVNAPTS